MLRFFALALVALAALAGCKTTSNQNVPRYQDQPGVSDGVRWKDPGHSSRTRNAFGTFMY